MHLHRFFRRPRFHQVHFAVGSAEFRGATKRSIVKRRAESLQHEPRRFLGDANCAMNLHAGDATLAIDQHPKRRHPFINADGRVLKNRIHFQRELPIAAAAQPQLAGLDEVVRFGAATGAMHLAIRPAKANGVGEGPLRIGEINDGFS
ncbi:MAG: hypothetical protein JWQ87_4163 [Candidatus Sulfotelmatobacter sp.]|nr:hypothetical protein [Candidatus Sulfotelmatobacter sp.]